MVRESTVGKALVYYAERGSKIEEVDREERAGR
jgi:hypothetical protein